MTPPKSTKMPERLEADEMTVIISSDLAYDNLTEELARRWNSYNAILDALERIERGESCIVGLRSEFIGHARQIAGEALAALRKEP